MEWIGLILGSKAVAYVAVFAAGILAVYLWRRLIRGEGKREAQQEAELRGVDQARRAAEKAAAVEREGAKAREDITADSPDSPHIRVTGDG